MSTNSQSWQLSSIYRGLDIFPGKLKSEIDKFIMMDSWKSLVGQVNEIS